MKNLSGLTIKKAKEMMKSGEISAVSLVSDYLKNIKEKNKDINAYLEVFKDALDEAEKIDEEKKYGKPLSGIPFAIKDNILIRGKICSAGSKMLENYSATYDASVIKKLREAGAIFLGRTNMDEFAMGASTENSAFGTTKNPHDFKRVAGGSSGGSAAAVAADMALAALGSDTGGSIRQPAGFCGVVGLNPTYGSVSRNGLVAMASSFDQIGPIAKTIEDAEIVFNVIKGKDEMDSTSVESSQSSAISSQKFKIGVLKYDKKGVDEDVNKIIDESIKKLKKLGHEIKEIDLPHIKYSVPCYYVLVPAEVSANLARFDGVKYGLFKEGKNLLDDYMETRSHGFGDEVRRRIMLGTYVLSAGYYDAYYSKAQKVRELIRRDFKNVFNEIDVILSPVSPTTAFKIGEKVNDPVQMYLEDIFTAPAKLAGVPAISVPAGKSKAGLPVGIQFIAPWFREDVLFNIGKQYQNE
ncbi:MAG: Asp-tRNA(Asn)/Glu-tRNA(Gln) amidotransferase subunit GatA [Candidatus Paceibacterota bacterium]